LRGEASNNAPGRWKEEEEKREIYQSFEKTASVGKRGTLPKESLNNPVVMKRTVYKDSAGKNQREVFLSGKSHGPRGTNSGLVKKRGRDNTFYWKRNAHL